MLAWRMIRDGCVLSITKSLVPAPANGGGGPHPHLQQAKEVCRSGKGGTKRQGNAITFISRDKPGSGTETKPGTILPGKTTDGLRMRNLNTPHSPPRKNRHDRCFETTQKRHAMFTPLKSPSTKCPRLSTPKKSVVESSSTCVKDQSTKEKDVTGNRVPTNSRLQSSRPCASVSTLPLSVPQLDSVSNKLVAVTGSSIRTPGSLVDVHVTNQHNRKPVCSSSSSSFRTSHTSSRVAPTVIQTFKTPESMVFPSTRTESFRTPQNSITPSTCAGSFKTLQNPVTSSASGGSFKTPQNTVTSSASGGSFRTPQNPVTSSASGGPFRTPQNTVTSSASGGSFRTPQNTVTSSASGGPFRTPQNGITSSASGWPFKTPQNNVALTTSGGSFKTPQNSVTSSTSAGSFRTPQNGITSSTTAGLYKTPQNGVTSYRTPQNPPVTSFSTMKATPPLCKCGRRAKKRMVHNPGPNIGRWFFSCVRGTASSANTKSIGCGFFQWEHAITMLCARAVTPVGRQTIFSRATSVGKTRPFMPVLQAPVTTSKGQRRLGVSSVPASTFR